MLHPPTLTLIRTFALVLTLLGSATRVADASTITYSTTGNIWPWTEGNGAVPGYTGTNVISFQGVSNGSFPAPGAFSLGNFVITQPTSGSTTYNNTEFTIELQTNLAGNVTPSSTVLPYSTIRLDGVLNGTVSATGQSTVVASILSIEPDAPMQIPEHQTVPTLDLPFPISALTVAQPVALNGSSTNGGTPLVGYVTTVPEPSAFVVSLTAVAGVVWIRRPRGGACWNRPDVV